MSTIKRVLEGNSIIQKKHSISSVLLDILRCTNIVSGTKCGAPLRVDGDDALLCTRCGHSYFVADGVPAFIPNANTGYWNDYPGSNRLEDLANRAWEGARNMVREWVGRFGGAGPSLEIGCGFGMFDDALPGYIGLDYSLGAVTRAGHEQVNLICGSAESLPFPDSSIGCIFSQRTLEHVPEVDEAFLEMDRVLKPGGLIIIKPAWHCTRFQTELIPIKKYHELRFRQKVDKALFPLLTSRPWKFVTKIPGRSLRRLLAKGPTHLRFGRLTPNFSEWIADSDACASIDAHEGILFFESRGYDCKTHQGVLKKILAGHDWVICRKPG